jgi:hypothetical protein
MTDQEKQDQEALTSLDHKMELVTTRVESVVRGYATGYYLFGTGGLGKSYTIYRKLNDLQCDFRTFNSRMTGAGLFEALCDSPQAVHVLEDMERLMYDHYAQGILRSALWSQSGQGRVVTWTTATGGPKRFTFDGGIIMMANTPLSDLPELRALATRITVHKLEVTDQELQAEMRRIAKKGWSRDQHKLRAEHALEVCDFLVKTCKDAQVNLDLRLFDLSCLDFVQYMRQHSKIHWHDLVRSRVNQSAVQFEHSLHPKTAQEKMAEDREKVAMILATTDNWREQVELWESLTGKGKSTFYQRKAEVLAAKQQAQSETKSAE